MHDKLARHDGKQVTMRHTELPWCPEKHISTKGKSWLAAYLASGCASVTVALLEYRFWW